MNLSKQADTIVGGETIKLSLEHLASVSGGGTDGGTVIVEKGAVGTNCTATVNADNTGVTYHCDPLSTTPKKP
jgi:hypothetical protein